jgi:hypothetical protein
MRMFGRSGWAGAGVAGVAGWERKGLARARTDFSISRPLNKLSDALHVGGVRNSMQRRIQRASPEASN